MTARLGGYTRLGKINTRFDNLDAGTEASDLRGISPGTGSGGELALVAGYDFDPQWRGIVRGGVMYWRARNRLPDSKDTVTGTDALWGLGMERKLDANASLRLSWDRYRVDQDDTDLVALGVIVRFSTATRAE